ncbi:MAG TPA: metal-dependent transcriptional regulator [Treponema sp.]|nr:metal-dependent transcriptional regulator [Treponema sp.]
MYKAEEDYLEAILMLEQKNGTVRSVDVAKAKEVTKPSVSHAMSVLRDKGFVTFAENNAIQLTKEGRVIAEAVYDRHTLLTEFLAGITGLEREQAEQNACRIEHDVDCDVVAGIKMWMRKNMARADESK